MHISETAVYYGSPGLSEESYELSGYAGLPFVLSSYRLRFSIVIRKLLMLGQMPETTKGLFLKYFSELILFLVVKRYLTQSFMKHGKLVFCNDDPTLDVNRYLGQLVLLIWELCDVYNLMKIPHNPFWPTDITPWTLADFNVPNKVSLFSGTCLLTFPYFRSNYFYRLSNLFWLTIHVIPITTLIFLLLILVLMMVNATNLV